jgi:hypothetical protein
MMVSNELRPVNLAFKKPFDAHNQSACPAKPEAAAEV